MKKLKLFDYITIGINLAVIIFIVIFAIVFKLNDTFYNINCFTIAIAAIINLVIIAVREYKERNYRAKKFSIIMHSTYAIYHVGLYYISKLAGNYIEDRAIYLSLSWGGLFLIILVFTILNFVIKDKNRKPQN